MTCCNNSSANLTGNPMFFVYKGDVVGSTSVISLSDGWGLRLGFRIRDLATVRPFGGVDETIDSKNLQDFLLFLSSEREGLERDWFKQFPFLPCLFHAFRFNELQGAARSTSSTSATTKTKGYSSGASQDSSLVHFAKMTMGFFPGTSGSFGPQTLNPASASARVF